MKPFVALIAGMALFAATGCAGPEKRVVSAAHRIRGLGLVVRDPQALKESAARFRAADLTDARLKSFSNATVDLLYGAAHRLTFYFPEENDYIVLQGRLLHEKLSRGIQTDYDVKSMYLAYLDSRLFDSAKNFRDEFPAVAFPTVPDVVISTGLPEGSRWRAYAVSDDGKIARLSALPLADGARVILVMETGCSAAEQALTDILGSKEFAGTFREHGLLLTERFDTTGVAMWKDHFRFDSVYIADKPSDFPGLDFHSFPQFYFMKNGAIVYHFDGWGKGPGYDATARLREGLKALAL